jgi:hypothetical protein
MSFYWVVYQKGSFPVKEPYACPAAAEQRMSRLMQDHWFPSLIPPDPPQDMRQWLERCLEIPPPVAGHG